MNTLAEQSSVQKEDRLSEECLNLKQQVWLSRIDGCRSGAVKIASMKASRDKLLFEIDRLSVELEFAESSRELLEKQRREQETLAGYWQQRADDRLSQIERLKEMLDETAEVHPQTRFGFGSNVAL